MLFILTVITAIYIGTTLKFEGAYVVSVPRGPYHYVAIDFSLMDFKFTRYPSRDKSPMFEDLSKDPDFTDSEYEIQLMLGQTLAWYQHDFTGILPK